MEMARDPRCVGGGTAVSGGPCTHPSSSFMLVIRAGAQPLWAPPTGCKKREQDLVLATTEGTYLHSHVKWVPRTVPGAWGRGWCV